MKLKDFLNEEYDDVVSGIIKDIEYIRANSPNPKPFKNDIYHIIPNKGVLYADDLNVTGLFMEDGYLKIPFTSINAMDLKTSDFKSFKNFPEKIIGSYFRNYTFCLSAYSIGYVMNSWEGFPSDIVGNVSLNHEKFSELSYSKINKTIKRLQGSVVPYESYKGPILSWLLVQDLDYIFINSPSPELRLVLGIFNRQCKDDKDILDCQEELVQGGYKEYAKL